MSYQRHLLQQATDNHQLYQHFPENRVGLYGMRQPAYSLVDTISLDTFAEQRKRELAHALTAQSSFPAYPAVDFIRQTENERVFIPHTDRIICRASVRLAADQ